MQIQRLENDDYQEGYAVYEISDPALVEPVFYIAINKTTKLTNVYVLNDDGKPNRVDLTNLRYRTELPVTLNSKEGVLIFSDGDKLDDFLVDILGEHAPIVTQDLKLQIDKVAQDKLSLTLTNPPEKPAIAGNFSNDLYQGIDPEVIDVMKSVGAEGESAPSGEGVSSAEGDFAAADTGGAPNPWEQEPEFDPNAEEDEEDPNA